MQTNAAIHEDIARQRWQDLVRAAQADALASRNLRRSGVRAAVGASLVKAGLRLSPAAAALTKPLA